MKKIELEVIALSHSITQSHNYAVVLGEMKGVRRLPIVIGAFEAQAIAVAMERLSPSRPLTHDLLKNVLTTFDIDLKEVIINNLIDGVFYARLVCVQNGEEIEIDSRTSDALAMAVRFGCPIFTFEFILESAGVVMEESENPGAKKEKTRRPRQSGTQKEGALSSFSIEDLQIKLDEVLEKEDYEMAAKIRDELKRRGKES